MFRLILLIAITVGSFLAGGYSLIQELRHPPGHSVQALPNLKAIIGITPSKEILSVEDLAAQGRVAMLSRNVDELAVAVQRNSGSPLGSAIGTALLEAQDTTRQVIEFGRLMRPDIFSGIYEEYAALHAQQELCKILRPGVAHPVGGPPGTAASTNPSGDQKRLDALRTAAKGKLASLNETFDQVLIWKAISQVALTYAKTDLADGRFEDCVTLCEESLSHRLLMNSPEDRDKLDDWSKFGQEGLDWQKTVAVTDGSDENEQLLAYILKYKQPDYQRYALHLDQGQQRLADLEWDLLVKQLPDPVKQIVDSGAQPTSTDVDAFRVETSIALLHDFCVKHSHDRNHWGTARSVSAQLLRLKISKSPALIPKPIETDLKEVVVRRSATAYAGHVIEEKTDDDVVTMKQPESQIDRRFFQDALVGKPEFTAESHNERAYRAAFNHVVNQLSDFGWDPKLLVDFVAACKAGKHEARMKEAESLTVLVTECEAFRKPAHSDKLSSRYSAERVVQNTPRP